MKKVVDYTRKWTDSETKYLMGAMLDKPKESRKTILALVGRELKRSAEACKHRWRTCIAHVEKASDGKQVHHWDKYKMRRARQLMDKGVLATSIARRFGVTKYAVWHKTKEQ